MRRSRRDLVSVVVPAFNAAGTLDETLLSARRQTYESIEIIVVNDGSTDRTPDIAERHALEDRRVRLINIANSGVAVARNTGVAASSGAAIAPLDADDLWHPQKLEKQMQAMKDGGADTGFVYTFHRRINGDGCIIDSSERVPFEGNVYLQLLLYNFVGNGSSPLFRREAIQQFGGYEEELYRSGAQGCEDYLLQALIAGTWQVRCVPEYLVGYRKTPDSMSTDWRRMVESQLLMLEHVVRRYPETPLEHVCSPEALCRTNLAIINVRRLRLREAAREIRAAVRLDAAMVAETVLATTGFIMVSRARLLFFGRRSARGRCRSFLVARSTETIRSTAGPPYRKRLARLARTERPARGEGTGSPAGLADDRRERLAEE
jgi:hypothetical protein